MPSQFVSWNSTGGCHRIGALGSRSFLTVDGASRGEWSPASGLEPAPSLFARLRPLTKLRKCTSLSAQRADTHSVQVAALMAAGSPTPIPGNVVLGVTEGSRHCVIWLLPTACASILGGKCFFLFNSLSVYPKTLSDGGGGSIDFWSFGLNERL